MSRQSNQFEHLIIYVYEWKVILILIIFLQSPLTSSPVIQIIASAPVSKQPKSTPFPQNERSVQVIITTTTITIVYLYLTTNRIDFEL